MTYLECLRILLKSEFKIGNALLRLESNNRSVSNSTFNIFWSNNCRAFSIIMIIILKYGHSIMVSRVLT